MKHARYSERGPVPQDVIDACDFELAAPASGQVRIAVEAAPINPSDVLTLTGQYGSLPPLPAVGGNEGVGRIEALGEGVAGLAVGQRVLLPVGIGTWSSHVLADARRLLPLPDEADAQQLSMLTVNPPTAALMLSQFVELKEGEVVIQNAGNSAVGGYLVQLARARGIRVVNVVRREAAAQELRDAGTEWVFVDGPDLAKRVAAETGKAPIRLAIDAVGGMATEYLARCLVEGGTVVNYGAMSGDACSISPQSLIFRDIALRGFWLAQWFRRSTPAEQIALYRDLATQVAQGALHARIAATYPLTQIRDAVAAAAAGERSGKIIVLPQA